MKADSNCLLQILDLSRVSGFKIPFSLSEVIPNASFLRDFTNDQNFFSFSFLETIGISGIRIKREDMGKMLPICISDDLLNMCSEPFVTALDVRDACLASM